MADDICTSIGDFRPVAIASPMQAPTNGDDADSISAMNPRKSIPGIFAICPMISPRISEQNSPKAMWLSASTMYFRNIFFIVSISIFWFPGFLFWFLLRVFLRIPSLDPFFGSLLWFPSSVPFFGSLFRIPSLVSLFGSLFGSFFGSLLRFPSSVPFFGSLLRFPSSVPVFRSLVRFRFRFRFSCSSQVTFSKRGPFSSSCYLSGIIRSGSSVQQVSASLRDRRRYQREESCRRTTSAS